MSEEIEKVENNEDVTIDSQEVAAEAEDAIKAEDTAEPEKADNSEKSGREAESDQKEDEAAASETEDAAESKESAEAEETSESETPESEKKAKSKKTSKSKKGKRADKAESKESAESPAASQAEKSPVSEESPAASESEKSNKAEKSPESKKSKKDIKNIKNLRVNFTEGYEKIQSNIPLLAITCVSAFIVMALAAAAIFFVNVKGPEKVLVPNVVGKPLEQALMEMQVKELYPKINLRYSDVPGDKGTILDQSPEAGAIVKGYSRVSLVVSRGVIVDKVEDYAGMNYTDLQLKLQALFAGQTKPLIVLAEPQYKPDASEAGTILEQDPPAGTSISEPVKVQLVVSRGPNYDNTRVPNLIGQSINDLLQVIARTKLVFNITSHPALDDEKPGTVVSQENAGKEYLPNYSRVSLEIAMPEAELNDNVCGIFQTELAEYPYPVSIKLDAVPQEGDTYTIVSVYHPGGTVTIPYAVPHGTTLILSVADKVTAKKTVN